MGAPSELKTSDAPLLRGLLASLPPSQRVELIQSLSLTEATALLYDWEGIWARPNQLEPDGFWRIWARICGRGEGKTKSAAQWAKRQMVEMPGSRGIVVARTYADARDTCIEGESGILACFSPEERATLTWNRSLGELIHPNGSRVKIYTSEKPDSLRGVQAHWAWCDELAAWEKHLAAWGQIPYVVRLPYPDAPHRAGRVVVTTTPRPLKEIRELIAADGKEVFDERLGANVALCRVSRGSTFDNWANLNTLARAELDKLKGTRMGRQELDAELLEDTPGALWTRALIERQRKAMPPKEFFTRVVIGVDPAVSAEEDSDETGIVVAARGRDGHRYVLEDLSCIKSPDGWAGVVIDAYERWEADCVVPEVNQGGALVEANIRAALREINRKRDRKISINVKPVHATRGKLTRAEPIATAYERGSAWHCAVLDKLEDQLCTWAQGDTDSPDRLDADVWALTDLDTMGTDAEIDSEPVKPDRDGPSLDWAP